MSKPSLKERLASSFAGQGRQQSPVAAKSALLKPDAAKSPSASRSSDRSTASASVNYFLVFMMF